MSNEEKILAKNKALTKRLLEKENEIASLKSRLLRLQNPPSPKAGVLRNVHELIDGKKDVNGNPGKNGKKDSNSLEGRVLFTTILGTLTTLESEIHLDNGGKISKNIKPSWDPDKIPAIPSMSLHYWWIYPEHPLESVKKDTQEPHCQDEVYLLLKGKGSIWIGENEKDAKEHKLKEGDLIFVPKQKWHRFKVAKGYKKGMKILIFFAPDYTG